MIQIQSILFKPKCNVQYWMKEGDNKAKRISKNKWFEFYDKLDIDPNIKMLNPITKE